MGEAVESVTQSTVAASGSALAQGRRAGQRERCPEFAAFIDDLRRVFGRAEIDAQIRRGMAGEPMFHVKSQPGVEPAFEFGTPAPAPRMVLDARQYVAWGAKIAELAGAAEIVRAARQRGGA